MDSQILYTQIRANIAFEHMIVAVLIAAAVSGGVVFVVAGGEGIFSGRQAFPALFGAFYSAVRFSFVAFLIGFFSAVVIGLPLFLTLEKAKLRKVWPYVAAGMAIQLVASGFVLKRMPLAGDFLSLENAPLLLPGILAALIFGRRMRPVWRAAEQTGEPARSYSELTRLH